MKKVIYSILVCYLIMTISISCEKNNESNTVNNLVFSGQLTNNSQCKRELKSTANTPDSLSCVEYTFDKTINKLTIKHINAGFNCCPGDLYVITSLNADTIIIQEHATQAICNCDCLYDLDIELTGVEAKKYLVKFIEPYAIDQQEILFKIDLMNNIEGEFCVIRRLYPWG